MPSPPFKLNPAITQLVITLPFAATWVLVDNPTGSPILARFGGTDVPTEDSCDMFIPFASSMTIPVRARDFAFGFQNVLALGNPIPQKSATITFGTRGEFPPSFGSIQQNKQNYYDRPNFKVISALVGGSTTDGPGNTNNVYSGYVVPQKRKSVLVSVAFMVKRLAASGLPGECVTRLLYQPAGQGLATATPAAKITELNNKVGDHTEYALAIGLPLLQGDYVNVGTGNNDTGSGQTIHGGDLFIYEFDA